MKTPCDFTVYRTIAPVTTGAVKLAVSLDRGRLFLKASELAAKGKRRGRVTIPVEIEIEVLEKEDRTDHGGRK